MSLIDELDALRDRARTDRRAYWFPLFLFGVLILLSPVVYAPQYWTEEQLAEGISNSQGPFPQFMPMLGIFIKYPDLVGWYWIITIIGGLSLTAWWYRRRARLRGVETDLRVPIAAAGAALLGFVLWEPMLSLFLNQLPHFMTFYSTPALNLPILFGSAVLAAVAFRMAHRREGWVRTAAVFAGTFLATVAFGAIGVYLIDGYAALMVIGVALCALAWWEHSVLLGVTAGAFLLVSVPANHSIFAWNISTIYGFSGWDPRQIAFFSVLAPGVVLLVGGVLAVVRTRR